MFGSVMGRFQNQCEGDARTYFRASLLTIILGVFLLVATACGAPAEGPTPTPTPLTSLHDALQLSLEAPDLAEIRKSVSFTLRVRNTTDSPVRLWGGVNHFDVVITREDGTEVWSFWHGKAVPAVLVNVNFEPGEVKDYLVQWDQLDNDGTAVPSGLYAVRGAFIASLTDDAEWERLETEPRWIAVGVVSPG